MKKKSQSKVLPVFLISLVLIGILFTYLVMAQEGNGDGLNEDDGINYIPQEGISIKMSTSNLRIPQHYTGEYRILNQTGAESDYNITFENVKSGTYKGCVLIKLSSNSEVLGNLSLYKDKNKTKNMDLKKSKKGDTYVFSYNADPYEDFYLNISTGNSSIIIIQISSAEHLNASKGYISDIYEEVKARDNVWSEEIPDSHYVRVVFEENLTNENDITIYPRVINGTPIIEVYEKDGNEIIAEFNPIESNRYNKVYLTNLQGIQDTFDLKIVGGNIEFDYIVDPLYAKFFEDWEAGNFDQWTNVDDVWTIATDRKQSGAKSAKCTNGVCDMASISINTSAATQVNVSWGFNDDDCDAGDITFSVKNSTGSWVFIANIDAGSLGGDDDTWYTVGWTTLATQYQHADFGIRFSASPDDGRENFWLDNINVTIHSVYVVYGKLIVNITKPDDDSDWAQYDSNLTINATVTCTGNAGAVCGTVDALARYNLSANPDTAVNTTKGDLPFYAVGSTVQGSYDGNWSTTAAHDNPTGVADNGTYVWSGDNVDRGVYKYYSNGTYISFHDVSGQIGLYNVVGLTTNNSFIWIMDYVAYEVYKYYMNMTYTGDHFDTSGDGENIRGITNNNTYFWITGVTNEMVNQYYMNGTHTGNSWDVSSEITAIYGITTDNNFIWIQCTSQNKIFKYYMNMTYTGESWDTQAGSEDGLEQDGTHFLVSDGTSNVIHKHNMSYDYASDSNPKTSPSLSKDDSYQFNWTLNVTTASIESYLIDVNFTSSYGNSLVPDNNTADRTVNLKPSVATTFIVKLRYPINWTNTTDTTPNFEFNSTGTASSYSCELFLNDTGYGTSPTASNATNINITANASLDGIYNWNVNCTANSVTNTSLIRVINISIVDSCSCPGSGTNWEIDLSDYCNITSNCNIGEGNITFINTGAVLFNATITANKFAPKDSLGVTEKYNLGTSCKINFG